MLLSSTPTKLVVVILAVWQPFVGAALLLNDSFDNLDNWITDIDGSSAVISIQPDNIYFDGSMVFTNISFCGLSADNCYRAELATPQAQRKVLFPTNTGEYWLGFSSYIPGNWRWSQGSNPDDDIIYNFQLHGGDNEGNAPQLGIRIESGQMTANVSHSHH